MNMTHLIVGPAEHGVTEYARLLVDHTGGTPATLESALRPGPVHVTFTDHLFGPDPEQAVDAVLAAVEGHPFCVSFHDVPRPEEGAERFERRSRAYRRLARVADLTVTNSRHEASFFDTEGTRVHSIPLPLPEAPPRSADPVPGTVGVLGFIYPGKGHETIVEAASQVGGLEVRALGGFSAGHEDMDLPGVEVTGYLPDEELWMQMDRIAIPVCAHRHFSASGSLMRWLAAGRRVLVTDSDYAREVAEIFPDQVVTVTDWPAALADAAADEGFAARVDKQHRWGWPEVATAWQDLWIEHFGPWLRGNIPPELTDTPPAPVSVVIPYYNDIDSLRRVIAGVENNGHGSDVEIIIADDGSTTAPEVTTSLPVTVVRQDDLGFRAAAARNLGVRSARHEVVVFLDGDTVPRPGYLTAMSRWVTADPRCVVVGTRLQDGVEPQWLRDAWGYTDNLRLADETSFRFIISSVLATSKTMFNKVGGFDETMVGYGGEDWELGWRLWNSGAIFLHDPEAIADHLEPDWAAREKPEEMKLAEKNAETIALASRITHPIARPAGVVFDRQDIIVHLPENTPEPVVKAWLDAGDVHVAGPTSRLFRADPRVGPGTGRVRIDLDRPLLPPEDLPARVARVEKLGGLAILRHDNRDIGRIRAERVVNRSPGIIHTQMHPWTGTQRLERWLAGW